MYYAFFGLNQAPFKITPDTDVFFEGGNRGAILEALIYAISNGEGIIKVTGEVGSGKTMLCRVLQTRLPKNVETVYLANPSMSPEEILQAIAFELQLPIAKDAGRLEVMHALNAYLLERHAKQRQVVVFVEESQGMPIPTLEEVRLLSNLETKQHKLLQIVLFGQPELDENLRQPQIRQLRERITHSFTLLPLDQTDVRAYLTFRLQAAGYHGPDLFSQRVIAYLTGASGGLTRRINLVADKALLAAFAEGTHNVTLNHVKAAVRDSEFSDVPLQRNVAPLAYALGGLALGGVIGVAVFAAYQTLFASAPPISAPIASTQPDVAMPMAQTFNAPATTPPATGGAAPAGRAPHNTPMTVAKPGNERSATINRATAESRSPEWTSQSASAAAAVPVQENTGAAGAQSGATSTSQLGLGSGSEAGDRDSPGADILEQRLRATEQWLVEQNGGVYSIQLLGTNDPELLRDYFKTIAKYLEIEKVYVYRTVANRRPSLTVLYGNFQGWAEVNRALGSLPEELKTNRPYYRTIQGVRSEIARHRSEQPEA
ncbi:MAG TPA: AAA family ATPase [Burkholderiales bacterium]|nr:AAA family ATPase [Burkholderiales bacterium]